jgi:putative FmdB family regulatory protein
MPGTASVPDAVRLEAEDSPSGNLLSMPIYEYVCMSCESHFEELVRHDETPSCPDCGQTKVQKQFSVFATHGSSVQPSFGGSGGGGCCGGSCGCGH